MLDFELPELPKEKIIWALQGAGIAALTISAIALGASLFKRPEAVHLIASEWTCTDARPQGVHAVCSRFERVQK